MKMLGLKLALFLLIFAVIGPMVIPGPDGQPIMTVDDWIPHDLIRSLSKASDVVSDVAEGGSDAVTGALGAGAEIYAWKDEAGVLHYSDTPIAGAETVTVPDDGLAIPSERFVQSGLAPAAPKQSNSSTAILLEERPSIGRQSSSKNGNLKNVDELMSGDLSKTSDLLESLPQLMEELKAARQQPRDI